MDSKIKIAILGGGGIVGAHAPGFARLADVCEVVAVAEPDKTRHEAIWAMLQKEVPMYTDYHAVLDLPGLDAVDILLPHNLHMEATIQAAQRGLHVLCEKVMARNTYECRVMLDACEKAGVQLVIAHDRRYAGDWVKLKAIIDSGELGEICFIKMEHNQNVIFPEGAWVRTKDGIGGGAIMSCLTHQIDALRWYLGEVDAVSCMTKTIPSRMEGECIGTISAQMQCGAMAMLTINWYTQSFDWSGKTKNPLWYEFNHVVGTKGEAYFMHGKGTFIKQFDVPGQSYGYDTERSGDFIEVAGQTPISGHFRCIEEFVKLISGQQAQILTFGRDTIKTVEVAEAAYISAALGKTVSLPVEPVPWEERVY